MRSRRPSRTTCPRSTRAARGLGGHELYSHQAAAWEATRRGEHVAITTGTASGKSLAFNLPVLGALAEEPKHRALYLYPTKALSQDQVRALGALKVKNIRARSTTATRGRAPLADPQVVEPHPDQPGHAPRGRPAAPRPLGGRLSNLRYVVVDEAHVYRGVFGSHVGNVLRRLRRLAHVYGADPQFLLASATIANPGELAAS